MVDKSSQYSAGIMAECSWFLEFKKIAQLKYEGAGQDEIKKACMEENLLGMATENRIKRSFRYVIRRVNSMDDTLLKLFMSSDLATQKIINLITILRGDRLFYEFMYEVYREKNLIGYNSISAADINTFFRDKAVNNPALASWKDTTYSKVRRCYLNFMTDANLLQKEGKQYHITIPILDIALERYLEFNGETTLLKAITGVR